LPCPPPVLSNLVQKLRKMRGKRMGVGHRHGAWAGRHVDRHIHVLGADPPRGAWVVEDAATWGGGGLGKAPREGTHLGWMGWQEPKKVGLEA